MAKQTIHCGTVTALEIIKGSRGPVGKTSGCGAYRNRKSDKKLRRQDDRRSCQG